MRVSLQDHHVINSHICVTSFSFPMSIHGRNWSLPYLKVRTSFALNFPDATLVLR